MQLVPKFYPLYPTSATTTLTLPENVIAIADCWVATTVSTGNLTASQLTAVTGTPGTTQVKFTGTPSSPSTALTLGITTATGQRIDVYAIVAAGNIAGY